MPTARRPETRSSSSRAGPTRTPTSSVSPDIATCDDCRRELLDPDDRRHDYPFTNCTNCGPRFTIIEDLPYDRERTTMRHFPLCPACRREYEDPGDRRFHAEPNACPVCGPRVRLLRLGGSGREAVELAAGAEGDPAAPIRAAAELLRAGEILAVKGLGGFHLACDATDGEAVRRLKLRKRRPDKPLAVMFAGLDELRAHCRVGEAEAELLTSPEHPIVLLEWREIGPSGETGPELGAARPAAPARRAGADRRPRTPVPVDPEVAVRQRYLGAMLPYTPLHILLLRAAGRPLVMTSGNLAEEPIVKGWEEIDRLTPIADAYLVHDREIAVRYDDSVAQVRGGRPRLIRRSRGYAPFPVALPRPLPQTLAAGAELKNTFCLTRDANAFLSQHIGDLENLETLEHYEASVEVYRRLFRLEPEVVAYDLHPEYLATKYALALPQAEKVAVQHHHAHVAARLVEHGREEAVIGVSMDGLGYGDDGRAVGRRGAGLRPDRLPPGRAPRGAAAARRRRRHRAAVADRPRLELRAPRAGGSGARRAAVRRALARGAPRRRPRSAGGAPTDEEVAALRRQVDLGVNAPLTTSCGRLFDAVAALAGVRHGHHLRGPGGDRAGDDGVGGRRCAAPPPSAYDWTVDGDAGGCGRRPAARRGRVGRRAAPRTARGGHGAAGAAPAVVRLAPLFAGVLADLEAGAAPGVVGARLHARSPRSCSTCAAGSAPPAGRPRSRSPAACSRTGCSPSSASACSRPTGSRCSPPAWCPSTTAASRWGRPRSRAILCSSAAGSFADRGASRPQALHTDPRSAQDPHMCLALPMRITAVDGARATIAAEGLEQGCSLMLVPGAAVGDYVLVHAGFAISVIDEAEAQETYDLLREIGAFDGTSWIAAEDGAMTGEAGDGGVPRLRSAGSPPSCARRRGPASPSWRSAARTPWRSPATACASCCPRACASSRARAARSA